MEYLKEVVAKAGLTRASAPAIAPPADMAPMPSQMPACPDIRREEYEYDEDPEDQEFEVHDAGDMSIKTANMELIEKVLRKHGGNRKAAAAELGISERTLYRKIKNIK